MSATIIWTAAASVYAVFYCWYIGFKKKVGPQDLSVLMKSYQKSKSITDKQEQSLQRFFENDDGKDFVMVNLIHLKQPIKESRDKLAAYQKIFLGKLLKKAGHPVMLGRAASTNIENVACDQADDWTGFGMVRYRSRRDLLEMLLDTIGSDHHALKLEAMEKTLAFPSAPWTLVAGPKWMVPMAIALVASVSHLLFM